MSENNYFKIDGLDIEYPIHVVTNGRKWNFYSEYNKRVSSKITDTDHMLMDLLVDTGFFSVVNDKFNVVKDVPVLVTDKVRMIGDKRSYYIIDYVIPALKLAIIMMNDVDKSLKTPKYKYLEPTLYNIGFDVIVLSNLSSKGSQLGEYMVGLRNSLSFRTVSESLNINYF